MMFFVKRFFLVLISFLFVGFSSWQTLLDEVNVVWEGNSTMDSIVPNLTSEVDSSLAPMNNGSTVDNCENGIRLNTKVPFIGDCIKFGDNPDEVNAVSAFPHLMWWLTKIMMTAILIFSFLMVIVGGTMMVAGWFKESFYGTGKKYVKNVLIALILLWTSGLILKLINPNFFWG